MLSRYAYWAAVVSVCGALACSADSEAESPSSESAPQRASAGASSPFDATNAPARSGGGRTLDFAPLSSSAGSAAPPPLPVGTSTSREQFTDVGTNPFVVVAHSPLSTFAADVDTASYDIFRRNVTHGLLPDHRGVRVEEFVNYFEYDYPAPKPGDEHPFRINTALTKNPLGRETQLLRVGIQAESPVPADRKPANLVFLVDVSGSMNSEDKLPLVRYLLDSALDLLNPDDKVSIVTYAGNTQVRLTPTAVTDKARIRAVVDSLTAGGSTNGASGIQLAYEQAESALKIGPSPTKTFAMMPSMRARSARVTA